MAQRDGGRGRDVRTHVPGTVGGSCTKSLDGGDRALVDAALLDGRRGPAPTAPPGWRAGERLGPAMPQMLGWQWVVGPPRDAVKSLHVAAAVATDRVAGQTTGKGTAGRMKARGISLHLVAVLSRRVCQGVPSRRTGTAWTADGGSWGAVLGPLARAAPVALLLAGRAATQLADLSIT